MSGVQPDAILSAMFCVICSLLMLVVDASGNHIAEAYYSMGLFIVLYDTSMVSFFLRIVKVSVVF